MPGVNFEFATANRILFGSGKIKQAGSLFVNFGKNALVFLGIKNQEAEDLISRLAEQRIATNCLSVDKEPTVEFIQEAVDIAVNTGCDFMVGFGGGSAIDSAKATAALVANPGCVVDYLEVIGKGYPLLKPSVPCIAIPTTAGTGAEVTRNAVLSSPAHKVKVSLRSPFMLPTLAIIDPELTLGLPPSITASTGLDALTQVIEPFVSNASNPLTDAFCREGMLRAARSLRSVFERGDYLPGREDMCLASLFGGLALANARLGAVHGYAGVIGGMVSAAHGAICARLLPFIIAANVTALLQRQPDSTALKRYDEIARILTGLPEATAVDGIAWVKDLVTHLNVPSLSQIGVTEPDIPEIVEKSAIASSMKGNPIELTKSELAEILKNAL